MEQIYNFRSLYLQVDRHNLCFAYGPSVGGGQLASAAVNTAGLAPLIAQAALMALGLIRKGTSPLAAVQFSAFAISILGLVTGASLPASKPKVINPHLVPFNDNQSQNDVFTRFRNN